MVRFGQKSTKMLSTATQRDDKIGGKVGNCHSRVVWLYRPLGSLKSGMVPALNILLRRCRAWKGSIATPPLPLWSRLKSRRFAAGDLATGGLAASDLTANC